MRMLKLFMALADTAFGGVDFLINNAGVIDPISHLETSDPDGWAQAIDINRQRRLLWPARPHCPA